MGQVLLQTSTRAEEDENTTHHRTRLSFEAMLVSWDAYVEARGNRYGVPDTLAGRRVSIRISLDSVLTVYGGGPME